MSPKSKRKLHLALAREAKRRKSESLPQTSSDQDATPGASPGPLNLDDDHSSSSSSSSSFTVSEASMFSTFIEDWASSLTRDDLMSLAIVLHYALVEVNGIAVSKAAKLIASMIGKTERTVRDWKYSFIANDGSFPESQQGKYRRQGIL